MKHVIEAIGLAFKALVKLSSRTLALMLIAMPMLLFIAYEGYTIEHKKNETNITIIRKVNAIDSSVQVINTRINNLYKFIDTKIASSDAAIIKSTAEQMKFVYKWGKENQGMVLESIDRWGDTYMRNQALNIADDTIPIQKTTTDYHIGVTKK